MNTAVFGGFSCMVEIRGLEPLTSLMLVVISNGILIASTFISTFWIINLLCTSLRGNMYTRYRSTKEGNNEIQIILKRKRRCL